MNEIQIDTREAIQRLDSLRRQLTEKQVAEAMRMAMNDATRWGRTRVKDAIRDVYNIKATRITDSNPKKGLSVKFASNNNLEAHIRVGHIPANMASLSGTRAPKGKAVSVEVTKGQRKTIPSAFALKVSKGIKGASGSGLTNVIFARGKRGKPKHVFGKPRLPIASLSSLSVATAAANTKAIKRYEPLISQRYQAQLLRQLERKIDTITTF